LDGQLALARVKGAQGCLRNDVPASEGCEPEDDVAANTKAHVEGELANLDLHAEQRGGKRRARRRRRRDGRGWRRWRRRRGNGEAADDRRILLQLRRPLLEVVAERGLRRLTVRVAVEARRLEEDPLPGGLQTAEARRDPAVVRSRGRDRLH